jgi:gamma-glutamylcysteine synthetase
MAYSPILTPDIDPLSAFKLLHGTVWRWIRPVMFENALTLEIRPLSTGPTATDMAANAAFLVGLTLHYYQLITGITQNLALARVKDSFYAAARNGLNAQFSYNHHGTPQRPTAVNEVLPQLVDEAQTALIANGVDPAEAQAHLDGIRYRLANGQTAASWLGQTITRYGPQAATTHYLRQSCGGLGPAVATWPLSY